MQLAAIPDKLYGNSNPEYIADHKLYLYNPSTQDALINYEFRLIKDVPANSKINLILLNVQQKKNLTIGKPILINTCDFIKNDQLFYPGFRATGNLPASCPIKKKLYKVLNYTVPLEKFPPILPIGKYICHLEHLVGKLMIQEIIWIGSIARKTN